MVAAKLSAGAAGAAPAVAHSPGWQVRAGCQLTVPRASEPGEEGRSGHVCSDLPSEVGHTWSFPQYPIGYRVTPAHLGDGGSTQEHKYQEPGGGGPQGACWWLVTCWIHHPHQEELQVRTE